MRSITMHWQLRITVTLLFAGLALFGQPQRNRNKVILISLDGFPAIR